MPHNKPLQAGAFSAETEQVAPLAQLIETQGVQGDGIAFGTGRRRQGH